MLKLIHLFLITCSLAFFSLQSFAEQSGFPETLQDDTRKVRTATSPKWLAAVGRFVSNTSASKQEQCTLSIVVDTPGKDGIIAVTAGHCVDHWYQGDGQYKVGDNQVTFTTNSGKKINRSVTHVLAAEMNPGDYAIVKLNAAIRNSEIKPLFNAPYHYSDLLDEEFFETMKPYASMAGYSADKTLGKKGAVLTYDEHCRLNGGARGMKKGYCYSYPGASGGPVVVTVAIGEDFADEPWQIGVQSYFVGSILGGRGGDDSSKTMFTDATHYTRLFDKILLEH